MNLKKKLLIFTLFAICFIGCACVASTYKASGEPVRIDCDGGTFREAAWANVYECGFELNVGESLSDRNYHLEDPTDIGRDFIGWNIYSQADGTLLQSMYTTKQVLDYKIPCPILVKAQYNNRAGVPVTAITYAAIDNETGEPVWDAKVTLIHDGVSYSGYGYVSISQDIYSKWTKTITHIVEAPGRYVQMDSQWCDATKVENPVTPREFIRHKSSYYLVSSTGTGQETEHPRSKINDIFYEASFVKPNVSTPEVVGADTMISDTTVIPANATMKKEVYESGKSYDTALATAQKNFNTSNIIVVDLELIDTNGSLIHQISKTVQVRLDIPSNYVIQSGNTVMVYYLENDGSLTECLTTYHEENGNRYVLFETNHFSPYVMVEVPEVIEEPEDTQEEGSTETTVVDKGTESVEDTETEGHDGNESKMDSIWLVVLLVVVVIAIVAGILLLKKRKA
jgi:hypothetical protein